MSFGNSEGYDLNFFFSHSFRITPKKRNAAHTRFTHPNFMCSLVTLLREDWISSLNHTMHAWLSFQHISELTRMEKDFISLHESFSWLFHAWYERMLSGMRAIDEARLKGERKKGKSGRENYSRFYIVGAHKLLWSRARESHSASVLLPTRCFFPPLYECEEARWKQIPFYYKPAKFMFEQKKNV